MAGASGPTTWLARAIRAGLGHRYPFALCYHGVSSSAPSYDPHGLFVSRDRFSAHLDLIEEQGYELATVSELARRVTADRGLLGVASVTFDDALASTARDAIPLILQRGGNCSLFVPTGLMGRPHPDVEHELIMGGGELLELSAAGVEIGAHTVDHLWLPRMSYEQVLDQMRRSRATLEDLLGKPVTAMAYPYGGFDMHTMRAAEEAGFATACACSGAASWSALAVPREPIHPSITALRLRLKMAGLYGPAYALVADGGAIGHRRRARERRAREHEAAAAFEPSHRTA
jgi:Polysaccharide deacetylase